MKEKLCRFYLNCILPELLDPRHTRNLPIRNPRYIEEAMAKTIKNKENKTATDTKNNTNICPRDDSIRNSNRNSSPISVEPTSTRYLDFDAF